MSCRCGYHPFCINNYRTCRRHHMTMHQPQTPELSVPALADWLRTYRDGNRPYIYQDPAKCLLGQYFEDNDAENAISEAAYEQFASYRAIAEPKPHTFGAALARAEKLLALPAPTLAFDQPVVDQGEPVTLPAESPDRIPSSQG